MQITTSDYKEQNTHKELEDLKPKEFNLFADDNKKIFNLKIGIKHFKKRLKRPRHGVVEFRDTNLLFPNSIKGYGEMLNKYYKTDRKWSATTSRHINKWVVPNSILVSQDLLDDWQNGDFA